MPARIIKADSLRLDSTGEAFPFVDLQRYGEALITSARREAEDLLESARQEIDQLRQRTIAEAQAEGRREGLRDADEYIAQQADEIARERVSAQLSTALPALRAASESLQAERDRWLVRWEQTAVRLGVSIAEKLLRRQLAMRPELANEMICHALRMAAGQPQLTVYLHPDDLSAWGDRAREIVESLTACADTTLVPDPQSMRGGCRIETRHGEVDARVETMLYRIAEELVED
jgi:flagellar assembly protein FliH